MKRSFVLVAVQFSAIIILIITGSIIPADIIVFVLLIIFIVFGIWAMYEFKFRFNIFPELKKNSTLITSGPYRIVRHPMYTAVFGITLIWVLNDFAFFRLFIWILLIIVIHFKSIYEEQILLNRFSEYAEYKSNTKKIIPFLY